MKTLAILLALTTSASAECLQWAYDAQGNRACVRDDLVNRSPYTFSSPPLSIIGDGKTYTTNSTPRCIDGYELVVRPGGQVMCARDMMRPEQ